MPNRKFEKHSSNLSILFKRLKKGRQAQGGQVHAVSEGARSSYEGPGHSCRHCAFTWHALGHGLRGLVSYPCLSPTTALVLAGEEMT